MLGKNNENFIISFLEDSADLAEIKRTILMKPGEDSA